MNDVGKRNGCVQSWLDGVPALDSCGFEFRKIPGLGIDALYFSTFFGGDDSTWSARKTERVRFDRFQVERQAAPVQ